MQEPVISLARGHCHTQRENAQTSSSREPYLLRNMASLRLRPLPNTAGQAWSFSGELVEKGKGGFFCFFKMKYIMKTHLGKKKVRI